MFIRKLRWLFHRKASERRLDREIQFHLESEIREHVENGMAPDEARRTALADFGSSDSAKEEVRDATRFWIEDSARDLRFTLRMIRREPVFYLVAIFTMALAIGANATIFSLVDSILFRPLNIREPSSLLRINSRTPEGQLTGTSASDFLFLAEHARSFSAIAGHTRRPFNLRNGATTKNIWGEAVTGNFFSVLGVEPIVGRAFAQNDGLEAVLSHAFWRSFFAADPGIVGRTITLNGKPYTVVGVAPTDFVGANSFFVPSIWTSFTRADLQRSDVSLRISSRLDSDVDLATALAELQAIGVNLSRKLRANERRSFFAQPEDEAQRGQDKTLAFVATVIVTVTGLVLVIGCANVAGLLLARSEAREKEIQMRVALGAGSSRLARQFIAESVLLALMGGILGLSLTYWAVAAAQGYEFPTNLPLMFHPELNLRVLLFSMVITLGSGIVFGLVPIRHIFRFSQGLLVGGQVAVSVLLLICAGLFVGALRNAERVDPGFNPENALFISLDLGGLNDDEAVWARSYGQILDRIRRIAGVRAAGLIDSMPLGSGGSSIAFRVDGVETAPPQLDLRVQQTIADPGLFEALGIPLVQGRQFESADRAESAAVAIINQTMAERFWPLDSAVGKRIVLSGLRDISVTVVGVAANGKYGTLSEQPQSHIWLPYAQNRRSLMSVVLRVEGNAAAFLPVVLNVIQQASPAAPVIEAKTLREHMAIPLFEPQLPSFFLSLLGAIGLLMACAGIFSAAAYMVSRRTREIGIRLAIGASRSQVLLLMIRDAMRVVLFGLGLGTAGALALSRLLRSLLHGLSPTDPLIFATVIALFTATALAACLIPAFRATRVDPLQSLKL